MTTGDGPAIRFEGLTKAFEDVRALDGVDLAVEQGEVFGFLGPNGAGKTTAIRIMFDLLRPTSGCVVVLGHDAQQDSLGVRRAATMLPSDAGLDDRMTPREYFVFLEALRKAPVDERYRSRLVRDLELDEHRRIGTLSRGNRQKVALIGALMSRPRLIVLDEPTSGLDPLVQDTVERLLAEAAAEGTTVFFSSHVLAEVEQICTRVAMLRRGRVIDVLDLARQRLVTPQRVTVTLDTPPDLGAFEGLPGIVVQSAEGPIVTFEVRDGIDALVKRLSQHRVLRLQSHEASLEEIFLSYYDGHDLERPAVVTARAPLGGDTAATS